MNHKPYLIVCISLFFSACTLPKNIELTDLKPFTTDGCSYYPEGTRREPAQWERCCVEHDKAYWQGGVRLKRAAADAKLRQCVVEQKGGHLRGNIMWLGVRFAGSPLFPFPFRWAYGWPYYRGYLAISSEEKAAIAGDGK